MPISTNTLRLAAVLVAAWAAPAAACDVTSATDISCGPANVNPANPLSMNNPSNPASPLNINNPANPASPLNINNPANPASPFNINNPANPASPFNPMNQDSAPAGPGGLGILSSLFGTDAAAAVTPPDGYEPERSPAAHHRRHRAHKRID